MHLPSATTHLPRATTTTTSPVAAFELRCREAEWLDRPETLVELTKSAPTTTAQRYAGLSEVLVADAIARSHLDIRSLAGDRVILTCEMPRYGIPLGVRDLDRPPVDDWKLRDQVNGDLLDTDRHGRVQSSVAMQVRRGLIAVAGALPLLMAPMVAHAGGPSASIHQPSVEQLPAFAPPKLPESTQPTPPVEQPTTAPPVVEPPPTPVAAPPAPRVQTESLSLTGNTLWDGLLGKQVRLEMKNGQAVTGTVVAQTASDLAVARSPDGTVVAVPKAEVGGVRLRVEADGGVGAPSGTGPVGNRPMQDGRGMHGGGIVLVSFGAIAALSGTVMLAIYPSGVYISLPLLLPGLAMIGAGSAMLSSAGKKRKAFNKAWGIPAHAKVNLTPTLAGGRNGGTAGLVLQF
jgi:hypothetical protein